MASGYSIRYLICKTALQKSYVKYIIRKSKILSLGYIVFLRASVRASCKGRHKQHSKNFSLASQVFDAVGTELPFI